MSDPCLSPSQRAYLFHREQFLTGLQERAERLFADGYRAAATNRAHRFAVTCPHKDGEKAYIVDAVSQTCTCPFFTRQTDGEPLTEDGSILACKHLRGLRRLVRQTRLAHFEQEEFGCGYRLWVHWIAALSELFRRRGAPPRPRPLRGPDGLDIDITTGERSLESLPEALPRAQRKETAHELARRA